MLKQQLDSRTDLQKYLFIRGFLVSMKELGGMDDFPFYGNWRVEKIGQYHFMTHKMMPKVHYFVKNGTTFFLLGHSYNPFTMEFEEVKQLEKIAETYFNNGEHFQDAVDELTGVFVFGWIDGVKINFTTDPSGMQSAYYGFVNDNFMITSHPQIIGDLYGLEMDDFVKKLIQYKWYPRVMGGYLPADLSQFRDVKRVVPNIYYAYDNHSISHKRVYPLSKLNMCKNSREFEDIIEKASLIIKNNLLLISKKWEKPAISLTGGMDSTTTFAAANGNYNKYKTFSYVSAEKESIDADAAKIISEKFSVEHVLYNIPKTCDDSEDFVIKSNILDHNSGYISLRRDNEIRKRIYLEQNFQSSVEVKSWGSETIRCRWHKHFKRQSMPNLSPKLFRNLYKIFIFNRQLANVIDKIYVQYIMDFEYDKIPNSYPASDMFFTEVVWGSWGGPNISDMKYYSDLTIPFNNRKFFELMFCIPIKDRISDRHLLSIKEKLNKVLYDMNIIVVNATKSDMKSKIFNIIFTLNMNLPF